MKDFFFFLRTRKQKILERNRELAKGVGVSIYTPRAGSASCGWESCGEFGDQRRGNEGCPLPFSHIWKLPSLGPSLPSVFLGAWMWLVWVEWDGGYVSSTAALEISQPLSLLFGEQCLRWGGCR